MKKTVRAMTSLMLAMALSLGNTVFALDGGLIEPVEPDYTEIVEEIFPRYDSQVSPQWSSGDKDVVNPGTHGYITQVAYDLLCDEKTAAYSFYSGQRTNLIRGSILPDKDETQGFLFLWHFYGPDGKSWDGSSVTAYTKCIEHYNDAVALYRSGSKASAMEELGRALHYLQDVNVPHHAMNVTAVHIGNNHSAFESEVEEDKESYVVTGFSNSVYTNADYSLGTIIDDRAEIARDWYDEASSSDRSDRDRAAGACVRNSQRATATVLYKFMYDVGYIVAVR